jgi:hypothetical protein
VLHISLCVCAGARVALLIHHATRVRHIAASLAPPRFPTLSHKRHDFRGGGGVTEHKMCVLIFCATFVRNVSHSNKN